MLLKKMFSSLLFLFSLFVGMMMYSVVGLVCSFVMLIFVVLVVVVRIGLRNCCSGVCMVVMMEEKV